MSSHLILTASHCLTEALWQASGDSQVRGKVTIDYDDPATGNLLCLSRFGGDVGGRCSSHDPNDAVDVTGFINPSYDPDAPDRFFDQSLLGGLSLEWPAQIGPEDAASYAVWSKRGDETMLGAAVRPGDSFFSVGFGFDDAADASPGTLRVAQKPLTADSIDHGVLRNVAGDVRMCKGDSGSPALWTFGGVPVVAAVHSGDDAHSGCAPVGANQFWALTETQSGFITAMMQRLGDSCGWRDFTPSADITMTAFSCW